MTANLISANKIFSFYIIFDHKHFIRRPKRFHFQASFLLLMRMVIIYSYIAIYQIDINNVMCILVYLKKPPNLKDLHFCLNLNIYIVKMCNNPQYNKL